MRRQVAERLSGRALGNGGFIRNMGRRVLREMLGDIGNRGLRDGVEVVRMLRGSLIRRNRAVRSLPGHTVARDNAIRCLRGWLLVTGICQVR